MIDVRADPEHLLPESSVRRISDWLARIAHHIARCEGVEFGEVGVLVVPEQTICELHLRFFNDPSATDVITFPGVQDSHSQGISGDIAICLDVAREQAEAVNHTDVEELVFLGVHGLLHLCGWSDQTPEERERMLQRQEELMAFGDPEATGAGERCK